MTDTDIRVALEDATNHLSTPPDLLDRVRAGGRRRVVRRRALLAGGLAVAGAGTAAGIWGSGRRGGTTQLSSPLLDMPTRGDLAADDDFRQTVLRVWHKRVDRVEDTVGRPHIVWAGNTPAGRVALVAQRIDYHGTGPHLPFGTVGLVEPGPDGPFIDQIMSLQDDFEPPTGGLVGTANRNILVLVDTGRKIDFSPDYRIGADGKVHRDFRPLAFDHDGAAVLDVGPQRKEVRIALRPAGARSAELLNFPDWAYRDHPGEGQAVNSVERALPGWAKGWPADKDEFSYQFSRWGDDGLKPYRDLFGFHRITRTPWWFVYGCTPTGIRFAVQNECLDEEPSRLLVLAGRPAGKPAVSYAGVVDFAVPLPIQARLPGGQGFVVGDQGATLRYRTRHDGDWLPVTGDTALLPDAATEVEVTRPGSAPRTVVLRR